MDDTSQLLRSFLYTIINEFLNASARDPKVTQSLERCRNCIRRLPLSYFHPFAKALIYNFLRGEQLGDSQRVQDSSVCWQIKRQTWRDTDSVRGRTIFNIKGNRYRLLAIVNYASQTVIVKELVTHAEYTRKAGWNR